MALDKEEIMRQLLKPLEMLKEQREAETEDVEDFKESDERMKLSLRSYVDNPTGSGTAYVAKRSAIKTGMNATFITLLRSYRRAFFAVPYKYDNGDILFHVKVPSEDYKNNKISYDVLFLFEHDADRRLALRNIRMFSNCPSFIYTYCYVYNKKGLIFDKLKDKLPNEALTKPPVIRNPIESMGYEKSTYIAGRYLLDGGCLNDSYIRLYGKSINAFNERVIFNKIVDAETIVEVYQHAKYLERKFHRKQISAKEKKDRDKQMRDYQQDQKNNRPKGYNILHYSPRSNITARKLIKIQSTNKKNIKNIKPKKI